MKLAIIDIIGIPYDGTTVFKQGLGGSESAVTFVSKELANIGFEVTVFNNCNIDHAKAGTYDDVVYRPLSDLSQDYEFDIVISSRTVIPFTDPKDYVNLKDSRAIPFATMNLYNRILSKAKIRALWMHDTFCLGDNLIEELAVANRITDIFTLSDWHLTYIANCDHGRRRNFEVLKNKIFVTRNGVNIYNQEVDIKAKDKNLFVYNASVTKGMIPLVKQIWPHVKRHIPTAKLKIIGGYYRFSTNAEPDQQEKDWRQMADDPELAKIGIEFTGVIPQKEIADILTKSNFMVYPAAFPETFGISTLESICYNTPLVTCRFGALEEIALEKACYLIDYAIQPNSLFPNINVPHQIEQFVKTLVEAYRNPYLHQQKQYYCNIVKDIAGWDTVALQWKQHLYSKTKQYLSKDEYRKVSNINRRWHKIFQRRYHNTVELENYKSGKEQRIIVISPMYNARNYIAKCIESVICQDYDNYHMYVIDDASTDNSYEIAKAYESEHVTVIKNDINVGAVYNQINTIRKYCEQGDIVILLDGDDSLINDNTVFNYYNNLYDGTTEFTYGSCWSMVDNIPLISQPYPEDVKKKGTYRNHHFNWILPYTHLRTFKKYLLDKCSDDLFKNNQGEWFRAGGDGVVIIRYRIYEVTGVPSIGGTGGPNAGGGGGAGRDGYTGALTLYKTHFFRSSGVFTITSGTSNVECLVVAGGGGAGSNMGGGGGAGGFTTATVSLSPGTYSVVVGAGGVGAPAGDAAVRGSNGGDSYILSTASTASGVFSAYFDGSNDTLAVPNTNIALGAGNWTIEFFCYPALLTGQFYGICGQGDFQYVAIQFNETSGSGRLTIWIDTTGATGWEFSLTTTRAFTAGQWYHIALVKNGTTVTIYIDGLADISGTFSGTPFVAAGSFFIGRSQLATRFFYGFISNFRITSGVAVYTGTFSRPTSPLTLIQNSGTNISAIGTGSVKLLICNTISLVDNSTFSATNTVTLTGNVYSSTFSPFTTMVAVGGGGGASNFNNNNSPASFGGSGGGVAGTSNTIFGVGISGQGNSGGASGGTNYPSGGGGAGSAGRTNPGDGGPGKLSTILGTSYYWSGGGGGAGYTGVSGNGGLGGGGGGAPKSGTGGFGAGGLSYRPGSDGETGVLVSQTNKFGGNGGANTGGGGGGGSHISINNFGGTGGSGFVAIRYKASLMTVTGGTVIDNYAPDDVFFGGSGGSGSDLNSGVAGTLGGGGGGGSSATVAGGGGGIGFNGAYVSGAGGAPGQNGQGGSGGTSAVVVGNGGLYGGGGGGTTNLAVDYSVGNGARGALKIFWQGAQLRYPTPVLQANITNLVESPLRTELLDVATTGTDYQGTNPITVNESINVPNYFVNNSQSVIGVRTIKVNGVSGNSQNLSINELKILVQAIEMEMMIVNNYDAQLATVQDQTKYQVIDQVTYKNDPRRVTVRVLNYVVGVTGEGPLTPTQIQTWF